jgi:ribosomal protein L40E
MHCPSCGAEIASQVKFCPKCGVRLAGETRPCPTCAAPNPVANTVCSTCGGSMIMADEASGALDQPVERAVQRPPEILACWRCGADNTRDKRFCRQCGTRLMEPELRLSELEAELASARASLSQMPAEIARQELETLDTLNQRLLEARQAYGAGDTVRAGELLIEVERASTELAARRPRLEETAKAAQQAQQARDAMAATIAEAKAALPQLTLVPTSTLDKAIRRLETRLASSTRDLQRGQFQRACTILTGSRAEKEATALRDRLAAAEGRQRDLETLAEDVAGSVATLHARLDDLRQQLPTEGSGSATIDKRVAQISTSLSQSAEMLDKGSIQRARQLASSAEAKLDALDQYRLARTRQRETRQAQQSRLERESATLQEKMGTLRDDLEGLNHLDASRQLKALDSLEERLAAVESAEAQKAERLLKAISRGLQKLLQESPALARDDGQIRELLGRVTGVREQYQELQQRLSTTEDPERQSVDKILAQLTGALEQDRFESPRPLENVLRSVGDPQKLAQSLTAKLEAERGLSERLARVQARTDALLQDLKDAQREGLGVREERERLAQTTALLGRVEELRVQGQAQEALGALEKIDEEQLDELKNGIEDRLASSKLLERKTTLSLTRMPESGGVTSYNVILNVSGAGWQDASSIQGSIKVAHNDRVDLRGAIDDLTTVINVLFGAQSTLRGRMPDLPERQALRSLSELGDLMYRLFLPTAIQRHLSDTENPILIASNDLELPWELMYVEQEFLCLRVPIGRMPMMREFPRRNDYSRQEKLHFLLIANPTGDLPATEKEVRQIASRLSKASAEVDIWLGDDVTGLRLHRALASGQYDVVHYSGHAYFNRQNPDESGLLLAGQNVFIAQTIQRTLRGRPLILLNACESGREMMHDGEVSYTAPETEGLASSFIRGGALGILGTLWPIFDEGAAEFAATFYDGLLSGQNLGEAARLARIQLRQSRPHDVTWASFVLYGDPTLRILE